MIDLMKGDCLERMKEIPSGSVDLIVCDLPYGTMNTDGGRKLGINGWDVVIDTKSVMEESDRILRKNGKMCLFAQDPFSTELKNSTIPNLPYNYSMIWEKDSFANALSAKKAPVNYYEDILVFSKKSPKHDFDGSHPLRSYFLDQKSKAEATDKDIREILGNGMGGHYFTGGSQFCVPTLRNYEKLQTTGFFNRDWSELKSIDKEYRDKITHDMNSKYPSTFNLWQGAKFKSNILKYKKDYDGHHPTQKPILLLEDLIKTFSNEGDLICDMTMGSGSTGVAAKNLNRKFIGIELDDKYFEIAKERIEKA